MRSYWIRAAEDVVLLLLLLLLLMLLLLMLLLMFVLCLLCLCCLWNGFIGDGRGAGRSEANAHAGKELAVRPAALLYSSDAQATAM